jgi:hypothetical protein
MKQVYLDAEYNHSKDEKMNVVCFSLLIIHGRRQVKYTTWLEGDEESKEVFRETIEELIAEDYTFFAFSVLAEGRSLHSLGIDPRRIRWVDLALEWRMLLNHNHRHGCGKHLVKGKIKTIYPPVPKWEKTEADIKRGSSTAGFNLSSALYKMVGVHIDTDHKNEMRDLIIAGGPFSEEDKQSILEYCESDVVYLPQLFSSIYKAMSKMLSNRHRKKLPEHMYERGDYAARSAIMESIGYPIDYEATRNFSDSTGSILWQIQQEINEVFPEISAFLPNKTGTRFVQKMKNIRAWVADQGHSNWMLTEKGELSLSLEAFQRYYDFKHSYPKNNFGAQMVRLLKTKQSLNGFMPNSKKSFWDYVGKDKRVRPYMGIYRAQSGRSQPASTGFIPLKSAWMRSLILPPPGRVIISIDYAQQEFLLAALLSRDKRMVAAYHSGDPYLYTGKLAGAIPQDGTKKTHGALRDAFKSTTLGISYMMGAKGLAGKLTGDTGREYTEEEAQVLIEQFEDAYPDYQDWKVSTWGEYKAEGYLMLPCGWVMWGDNHNRRSVCNFPVQGAGSSIMRKAVALAQDQELDVIFTLHDALYVEVDADKVVDGVNTLAWAMDEACRYYFIDTPVEKHAHCRMDPAAWGPDFDGETINTDLGKVSIKNKYVDERSVEEYQRFKKYFCNPDDIKFLVNL